MKKRLFLARAELFLVACLGLVALSIPASSLITPASAAGDECSQTKAKSLTALDDACAPASVSEDAVAKSRASYGRLPISFELNRGQTNQKVKFLSRGQGFGFFLTPNGAVLSLSKTSTSGVAPGAESAHENSSELVRREQAALSISFRGANPSPRITGVDRLPGNVNYFVGKDPRKWRQDVQTYSKVRYRGLYRGIDLIFYGNQEQLEYDLVVAPGANPNRIKMGFAGAEKIAIDDNGDLVLSTSAGNVIQKKPVAYQEVNGKRREVLVAYRLKAETMSFKVGHYDKSRPLIIDPVVAYSTFLGGNSFESGLGIAVDAQGNAYLTGETVSTDFPIVGGFQTVGGDAQDNFADAYVVKLNPTGTAILYSTYLGGNDSDTPIGITIDSQGNAFVAGTTSSSNFPVTAGVFQQTKDGLNDVFVTKLNPSGSALLYSTFIGGDNSDTPFGIAVRSDGRAHVVGRTDSTQFNSIPLNRKGNPAYKTIDGAANWSASSAGLAGSSVTCFAFDSSNSNIIYAGTNIGVFKSSNAGTSWSLTGTGNPASAPPSVNALVTDPSNPSVIYAASIFGIYKSTDGGGTYTQKNSGFGSRSVFAIAIDPLTPTTLYAGMLSGMYKSTDGGENWLAIQNGFVDPPVVFALVIDPSNPAIVYAGTRQGMYKTINGGALWSPINNGSITGTSQITALVIDPLNPSTLYAGSQGPFSGVHKTTNGGATWTNSTNGVPLGAIFGLAISPTTPSVLYLATSAGILKSSNSGADWVQSNTGLANIIANAVAVDPNNPAIVYAGTQASSDAFAVRLSASGSTLEQLFSFGGPESDEARGVALDASGSAYLVGTTSSPGFPVVNAFQPTKGASVSSDAFVAKLNDTGTGFVYSTFLGGSGTDQGRAIAVRENSAYVTGTTISADFPTLNAFQPTQNSTSSEAFVTKFNATGSALDFSSYHGGGFSEQGLDVGLDSDGAIYLTGLTSSQDFPTVDPTQPTRGGSNDAFITKIDPSGVARVYSSYLGGSSSDQGNAVAVDSFGSIYVIGNTSSANFPTVNPLQPSLKNPDAFVTKIAFSADVLITMEARDPVMVGNNLTYTLTISNLGTGSAFGLVLSDTLPAGVTFVSAIPSQGSCSGTSTITCNLGQLARNTSAIVTLVVTPQSVGNISNTATIATQTEDPNPANNSATLATRVSALPSIAGRVATAAGLGLPSVNVTLTGSQTANTTTSGTGFYQFADLAAGGNYTVTPTRQGFVFHPQNQSFTNLTADATADFQSVACIFSITPRNQSFTSSGGNGSVAITASDSLCPWTATSDVPWITITSPATGFGSSTVNFSVAPTASSRSGTLRIANNVFTVWQELSPCAAPSFNETPHFPAGLFPWFVESGDFNNDGKIDVAVINEDTNQSAKVSVVLSNGAGGFGAPISVNVSGPPRGLALSDFNNDGNLDAAVVLFGQSNNVQIFLGNGAGNLTPFGIFSAGGLPAHAAVGDFNRDGKSDLAVANENSHNVSIMLGTGTGAFSSTQIGDNTLHASKRVVIGDFNHDNKQDLVVLGTSMPLIMGNGDGTFAPPVFINGLRLEAVVVGDFNKDGHEDLAGTTQGNDGPFLSVSLNNGFGGFGIPINSATGGREPGRLEVADFNGDGNPDLGSGNIAPSSRDVNAFLGNGAGAFTPGPAYLTGLGVRDIVAADFNGDGKQDIVASTVSSLTPTVGEFSFLAGTGAGSFVGVRSFIAPAITQDVVSLDFNGDTKLDLLVISQAGVSLMPGSSNGEFGAPVSLGSFPPANSDFGTRSFSTRDFNHDGKPDLAVKILPDGSPSLGVVRVYLNNGSSGLTLASETQLETYNQSVHFADFNGDGNPDLIAINSSVLLTIRLGNGAGGFGAPTVISPQFEASRLESGDFNGDGKLDLAVTTTGSGPAICAPTSELFVLFGDGAGGFSAPAAITFGGFVGNMLAYDLNGDGKSDLIVADTCAKKLNVLLANASGGFTAGPQFSGGDGPRKLALADLNGDGKPDLIVTNDNDLAGPNIVSVLIGDGAGGFSGLTALLTGFSPASVGVGDYDNNGRADLAVSDITARHIAVFINQCAVTFPLGVKFTATQFVAEEGAARVAINISRDGDASGSATVDYKTTDTAGLTNCNVINGIASARCDYAASVGTVRFAGGETSKTFSIPIVDDVYAEGVESFTITLSNATGVALGGPATATVTINDNETVNGTNPIDQTAFFVRQHYVDFLGREPDPPGAADWEAVINTCPAGSTDCDRIHVSSAFFRSPEFQVRGYFVYRFYPVAFGRKPDYDEFIPDLAKVSGFLSEAELEAAKLAFIAEFMSRPSFVTKFNGLNNTEYVDTLLTTADITHPARNFWIVALGDGSRTRADVLREISDSTEVSTKYFNQAFVVMQYFGYLRRQPDAFYLDWIDVLDSTGDFRGMVSGFMNSAEYRSRFGP